MGFFLNGRVLNEICNKGHRGSSFIKDTHLEQRIRESVRILNVHVSSSDVQLI